MDIHPPDVRNAAIFDIPSPSAQTIEAVAATAGSLSTMAMAAAAYASSIEIEEGELPADEFIPMPPELIETPPEPGAGRHLELVATAASSTPRKPVLSKEKAKQRLKSLGIQKKIQMESRNLNALKKTPIKFAGGETGGGARKDKKFLSPHEKAQLTIKEIEVMKREEERPKVTPMFFHESMIHRITADSYDENKVGTIASSSQSNLSFEALKAYEDDDAHYRGRDDHEQKRKRAKPEAYRRRRRSDTSPLSAVKHKLKFKRDKKQRRRDISRDNARNFKRERYHERDEQPQRLQSNAARSRSARPSSSDEMTRYNRRQGFATLPGGIFPESARNDESLRFTRARPVISFRFNSLATQRMLKSKSKHAKKLKKRKRGEAKDCAVVASVERGDRVTASPIKVKQKKKRKDGRDGASTKKSNKKKSKKSKNKQLSSSTVTAVVPTTSTAMLSFNVDDLNFEEDLDEFPLSKEGFQPTSDTEDRNDYSKVVVPQPPEPSSTKSTSDENIFNSLAECSTPIPLTSAVEEGGAGFVVATAVIEAKTPAESAIEDKSPDTDDYMPNWEEEDEDTDKDDLQDTKCIPSNDDAYSSGEDTTPESIKDGLGTPIYVNPSPPNEIVDAISFPGRCSVTETRTYTEPRRISMRHSIDNSEDEEESHTPPPVQPKLLFEMENIYEQFLKSVREDPDFKDNTVALAEKKDEISYEDCLETETSGILSQSSSSLHQLTATTESSPTSSSSSVRSSDSNDTSSDTESTEKRSTTPPNDSNTKNTKDESPDEMDDLPNIPPDDLKKLKSVRKRHGILKWIRQQVGGMDEEDRHCLLGLEKLIRAERQLLLRNDAIRKLHEQKRILGTDSEDSNSSSPTIAEQLSTTSDSVDNGTLLIHGGKREAIKLTITNNSPMKLLTKNNATERKSANENYDKIVEDDQDFTERLMKAKETSIKQQRANENMNEMNLTTKHSKKRKERHRSSLSLSPMRRSRNKSPSRARNNNSSDHSRRQGYNSPSPNRIRRQSHESKRSSRSRTTSTAIVTTPLTSSRHFSRSPTMYSNPSSSRSSSQSPMITPPGSVVKDVVETISPRSSVESHYSGMWNVDRYIYIGDSYYYPRLSAPTNGVGDVERLDGARYPTGYHDYSTYSMYANEYMHPPPNYSTDYEHQMYDGDLHNRDPNSYLNIPVIGGQGGGGGGGGGGGCSSSGGIGQGAIDDYFYKNEFDTSTTNESDITCNDAGGNSAKPFAVQKGNVLEIVPATILPHSHDDAAAAAAAAAAATTAAATPTAATVKIKEESRSTTIKRERIDTDDMNFISGDQLNETDIKRNLKMLSKKGYMSLKNEVARRHVVSAVLRLNKETDDNIRGILKSHSGNSGTVMVEKKKVLFADGIPPGRSSSASSDEESTLKFIRKRLKKTQRRMLQNDNKENENVIGTESNNDASSSVDNINFITTTTTTTTATLLESKGDRELWDAPPPAPPIGSPPPHLPQPLLIRPASPDELLYFHYDSVYNMMYVSPMENAIPPRLLQNNDKSGTSNRLGDDTPPVGASNGDTTPDTNRLPLSPSQDYSNSPRDDASVDNNAQLNDDDDDDDDVDGPPSAEAQSSPVKDQVASPVLYSSVSVPSKTSSPPQPIQNIVSMRMNNNSPIHYSQSSQSSSIASSSPLAFDSQHSSSSHSPQLMTPRLPLVVSYPGQLYSRTPNHRASPNLNHNPYNIPLPTLHNRPFNPHIPPPFHQSPASNSMINGLLTSHQYDSNSGTGNLASLSTAPGATSQLPPHPYNNPHVMMYNSNQQQQLPLPVNPHSISHALPPRPLNYGYGVVGPPPPGTHMLLNRTPNRFPSIPASHPPAPVPMPQFLHGGNVGGGVNDRNTMISHSYRQHPPPPIQPMPQNPPTPPPDTTYS